MTLIKRFLSENEITSLRQKLNLAAHPGIEHETMLHLAGHHPEHSHDENQAIRLELASNPSLFKKGNGEYTSKVVKKILKHKSNKPGTYEQIGRQNHNLDDPMPHVFKMLADHHSPYARKVAADYRPHENYEKLKNDPSPLVHASLAKEFPEKYAHEGAPMGARIIAGMALHGENNHLEDHIHKEHPSIRAYVARHTKRLETMENLATTEEHPRVKERLARNKNLPGHVKEFLKGDHDSRVRRISKYVENYEGMLDLVFSMLEENTEPVQWKHGQHDSYHEHTMKGQKVSVLVQRTVHKMKSGNDMTQHSIGFKVNNAYSKQAESPNGAHILSHVAHVINDYMANKVKKGDLVTMTGRDQDKSMQDQKEKLYGAFVQRLAKRTGGSYNKRTSKFANATIHSLRVH